MIEEERKRPVKIITIIIRQEIKKIER